jgi:fatty-acid desaturase
MMNLLLTLAVVLTSGLLTAGFSRLSAHRRRQIGPDSGQATTEYALVLLGAALIGLILITWATAGGAEGRIGQLFDSVIDSITSRI